MTATTPERLVAGALACLAEHGVAGTTSRRIAAAADANLAAITYHFGSKETLVATALVQAVRTWLEPALTALRGGTDPAVRTVAAMKALREAFAAAAPLLPAYYEAVTSAPADSRLCLEVVRLLGELQHFLAGQIRELRDGGFLPEWVDPDAMAALQLAAADGVALHRAMGADAGIDADRIAAQMAQLLFAATSSPPEP